MKPVEEKQVLEARVNFNNSSLEIQRILRLKGDRRLAVENEITDTILSHSESDTPGLRLKFLESRRRGLTGGDWIEYFALYKMKKWVETANYLEYVFSSLAKLSAGLKDLKVDSIGLQEVDCSEPGSYYVLFYILSDGRESNREQISDETEEYCEEELRGDND